MISNFFKTAWRNLTRTFGYSLLNMLGLAIGMAVALIIGLWVYYHYTFDKSIENYESVYRVKRNFDSNGDTLTFSTNSPRLAEALRNEIPEIEYVATSDWTNDHGLTVGEKKLYKAGSIVGPDFLHIFPFPLLAGDASNLFSDAYSIVLTQSLARALFGEENPINKRIRFDNEHDLKVTGVLKDLPANSSFYFNYLVPSTYLEQAKPGSLDKTSFSNNRLLIYVKLREGASYARAAPRIRVIEHVEKDNIYATHSYVTLQPMDRWHLYSNYVNGRDTAGFLEYVKMFLLIGILVLVIACINFINLTTARSEKRAREVGVRKTVGSRRKDLVLQFLLEAMLMTTLSFGFCILLTQLAIPSFNQFTGSAISIPYQQPGFWLLMTGSLMAITLIAGARPAFFLSGFDPVRVLKGTLRKGSASPLSRKVLVVTQFTCSVALIISTITIYRQIEHARNRPSGYNLDRLITTYMNSELNQNFTALKNDMISQRIASAVTTATSPATNVYWHTDLTRFPGKKAGETLEMGCILVSPDYFKTMDMQVVEGRDFKSGYDSTSVIFNQTAIQRLRLNNPVGQRIEFQGKEYTIAGVVRDALMISPFLPAEPTMFYCYPDPQGVMMYRLSPDMGTQQAVTQLTTLFAKYNPSFPYAYSFADTEYAAKFNLEVLIGKLAGLFSILAIFISCLGLFGLAAYMAEQRKKEIGIRKTLGASVNQIWMMLSRDFLVLVVLACLIATPVAYYFLHGWLTKYNYRIPLGPDVFILGSVVALIITLVTISFQSFRAAMSNPVKSLRTE